jgi:hypothetical protein
MYIRKDLLDGKEMEQMELLVAAMKGIVNWDTFCGLVENTGNRI